MAKEWQELTKMTRGKPVTVERVKIVDDNIAIEGSFALPPLANLSAEDQVFVMAFVKCGGTIKEMEEIFGISYPTVKNRLARIAKQFEFVEVVKVSPQEEVLTELERGEISADEAIRRLQK
ncbi:MAG TPA: DUF2089 domain-containing protein [Dehalococcoidales bacterium]|nr:DUF2089 domain-containing protein [Dehalococcoidales bacterium]